MKELTIISGKGGTGKTSIAACFAALMKRGVLVDCDVDAADFHLILNPTDTLVRPFVGGKIAVLDSSACTGCGKCAEACRFRAIRTDTRSGNGGTRYEVDQIRCEGCGVCAYVCPESAIHLEEDNCGEWLVSQTRFGPLIHARLHAARGNSGKLVTLVRGAARELAQEQGASLILVDGPPGIGCPVIASLTGANVALVVTEPTLSGLHDLHRVVGLTRQLRVPTAVCVNKWDLSGEVTSELERWCGEQGIPVIGRVPYDQAMTDAQVRGVSLIEHAPGEAATAIRSVWDRLSAML